MTTEPDVRKEAIEAHAMESFGFLELSPDARTSTDLGPERSLLAYTFPQLFIDVELDWQEWASFVLVGRTVGGQRPDGYYVDTAGRKVRWHLNAALEEGGFTDSAARLRRLVKKSGPAAMLEQIDGYARELGTLLPSLPALIHQLESA